MISRLINQEEIYQLNDNEKLLFLYSQLELTKIYDINTQQDEREFLHDLERDEQFKKDTKNYCRLLLEDMRQKYESLKELFETL